MVAPSRDSGDSAGEAGHVHRRCLGIVGAMMGGVATTATLQGGLGFVKIMAASRSARQLRVNS